MIDDVGLLRRCAPRNDGHNLGCNG